MKHIERNTKASGIISSSSSDFNQYNPKLCKYEKPRVAAATATTPVPIMSTSDSLPEVSETSIFDMPELKDAVEKTLAEFQLLRPPYARRNDSSRLILRNPERAYFKFNGLNRVHNEEYHGPVHYPSTANCANRVSTKPRYIPPEELEKRFPQTCEKEYSVIKDLSESSNDSDNKGNRKNEAPEEIVVGKLYSRPSSINEFDPIKSIEFSELKCGRWSFIVGQYNNSVDFIVVNGQPELIAARNRWTDAMNVWYSVLREKLTVIEKFLDKGLYCGFCQKTTQWYRVQVDLRGSNDSTDENITVLLIDYGKIQIMNRRDLKFLKPQYTRHPRLAFFAETLFDKKASQNIGNGKRFDKDFLEEGKMYNTEILHIQTDSSIIPFLTLKIIEVVENESTEIAGSK